MGEIRTSFTTRNSFRFFPKFSETAQQKKKKNKMKAFYIFFTIIAMASATTEAESRDSGVINVSSLLNSNYAALAVLIIGFLVLDVVLGAKYFGDLTVQKRRRQAYLRRYYQTHPQYRRQFSGYNRRIGSFDYEDEGAAENDIETPVYQRLVDCTKQKLTMAKYPKIPFSQLIL